jgi:TonB family protein
MKYFVLFFLGLLFFTGCEKKNVIEVIPDYNSIYLSSENVDTEPRLVEGDENQLTQDIKKEMTKNSQDKINLEYNLLIGENGKVDKLLTLKSAGTDYSNLVATEISSWKFEPAVKNGKAVKSQYKWELRLPPTKTINENEFKVKADSMPSPVGGMYSLQKNIIYPEKAKLKGIEGKVIVQAYIDETGSVVKTEILKSAGDDLDEAAMKALKKTKFTPGIVGGKPVKVKIVIPIVFKLS